MKRIAIVLFNLGGPDSQAAVKPFLFNLFNDPAIIRVPAPLRFLIAKIISAHRTPIAKEIYRKIGGHSPIVENTKAQARALENILHSASSDPTYRVFIAMRYWHPFSNEAAEKIKAFAPHEIVLLPLYPQFSTTTTLSSFTAWRRAAKAAGIDKIKTCKICCYPQESGFIQALAEKIAARYDEAAKFGKPRLLFSAHGLPEKIVRAGDPYPEHCEQTAQALGKALGPLAEDSVLCYQSRVGPMRWIEPSTENEVKRAGRDKVPVIIVPIAFVSDHSETLVELDIDYRALADACGVPLYIFIPAVGAAPAFMTSLAQKIRDAMSSEKDCLCACGARACPQNSDICPEATGKHP